MATRKPADIEEEIRANIDSDPSFTNTSKLMLNVSSSGMLFNKKVKVVLEGSMPTKTQKDKLERWIENKYGDRVILESSLQFG